MKIFKRSKVQASKVSNKKYIKSSEEHHDSEFWINLIESNWDSLRDAIVDLMRDASGRPQQDLYLYPDGSTTVFWNPGGNSWINDDCIVIYNTSGYEYYSDLDDIDSMDVVELFAEYDSTIWDHLEQLRIELECDDLGELLHEINIESELRDYNSDAYETMMNAIFDDNINYAYDAADEALRSKVDSLEEEISMRNY